MARALKAFSLVELMIGMALITLALLAMIGVFFSGLRLMTQGESLTAATETGRALLEQVKVSGYDAIPAAAADFDARRNDAPLGGFPPAPYPRDAANQYPIRVRVNPLREDLKVVAVEVYFDPSRPPVVLETFFNKPPAAAP
jgi:type II secretory pathway pseudopilin PulG